MSVKKQAKGYKGKTVMDFETDFGVVPESGSRSGWRIPIKKNSVAATAKLSSDDTLTGRRDPVAPDVGNVDVSGSLETPLDAHNTGLLLRAMFGLPTTVVVAAPKLDAAAAVNKGGGKVGLPCTGHGLAAGAPVVIAGTTSYDGHYVLNADTSANELVIAATFTAETFTGLDETVTLAQVVSLSGAARDAGSGKVGLPAAAHGLPVGSRITVDGSTHYDTTYTVLRGSGTDELLVTATYEAETFGAGVTATAPFYDHTYVLGDDMPSFLAEKAFPDIPVYFVNRGLKTGKLSLTFGGEGNIGCTIDLMGAGEDKATSAYVAAPVELPVHKFSQKGLTLKEGGTALSNRVKTVSLNLDFGLDGDAYTINTPDKAGERGDISEGVVQISGDLEALFTDVDLVDKALATTKTSLDFTATAAGYQIQFSLPEVVYERTSPPIDGPKGVLEKHAYQAFYESASDDSCIVVRLRNEIYTWEH